MSAPRRFHLDRLADPTGYSGTGCVADGVTFDDGTTVLHWRVPGKPRSTTVFITLMDAVDVHGHDGLTAIAWLDPPERHDHH